MRKLSVLVGLLLLLAAVAMLGYRWVYQPARHGGFHGQNVAREYRQPAQGDRGSGPWRGWGGRGTGNLQIFEIVIDVLNVVVGIVGIWLAVVGLRMQRSNGGMQRVSGNTER